MITGHGTSQGDFRVLGTPGLKTPIFGAEADGFFVLIVVLLRDLDTSYPLSH